MTHHWISIFSFCALYIVTNIPSNVAEKFTFKKKITYYDDGEIGTIACIHFPKTKLTRTESTVNPGVYDFRRSVSNRRKRPHSRNRNRNKNIIGLPGHHRFKPPSPTRNTIPTTSWVIPDLIDILPPEINDMRSHLQLKDRRPKGKHHQWWSPIPPPRWPRFPSRSKIGKMFPEVPKEIFESDKPTSWSYTDDGVSININYNPGTVVEDGKVELRTEGTNQV